MFEHHLIIYLILSLHVIDINVDNYFHLLYM